MADTVEARVKKQVRLYLHELGAYTFMPVQMGMGAATLDFLACVPIVVTQEMVGKRMGFFVSIETKAAGKKATKRQEYIALAMQKAGAITVLAYGVEDVQRRLVEAGLR